MGPYLDNILFVTQLGLVVECDRWVCLEQDLPDPGTE